AERQHIRWRTTDDARFQIADELDLPLRLPAARGHNHAAQFLRAAMQAEPSGEKAVAIGVVQDIAAPPAGHEDAARDEVVPQIQIGLRVAYDGGLAAGAGRGMQP